MHAPGGGQAGQCGTQGRRLFRADIATLSYPLKTSLVSYQMLGCLPFAVGIFKRCARVGGWVACGMTGI